MQIDQFDYISYMDKKKKYITRGNIFYTRGNISRIIMHLGKGKKDVTFEGE